MADDSTRLERSTLFVPASRWPMIEKAVATEADAVCLDLEDSVNPAEKDSSRKNVVAALNELDFGDRIRIVRVNGVHTQYTYRDVVHVVEGAGDRLDLLMLPKVSSAADIAFVARLLTQIEERLAFRSMIGIEAQVETAAGFLNVREIAAASPRLEALIFGAGDYAASMRMPASGIGIADEHDALYPGHRWHAVMHAIVAAARAHSLRCMDGPYSAHTDAAGFERSCRIARAMGFDGKQCIHPSQVNPANAIFAPTDAEIEYARKVLNAHRKGVDEGLGAVSLDGRMIDHANVRMASEVVEQAIRIVEVNAKRGKGTQ